MTPSAYGSDEESPADVESILKQIAAHMPRSSEALAEDAIIIESDVVATPAPVKISKSRSPSVAPEVNGAEVNPPPSLLCTKVEPAFDPKKRAENTMGAENTKKMSRQPQARSYSDELLRQTEVNLQAGKTLVQTEEVPHLTEERAHVSASSHSAEASQPAGSSGNANTSTS
ncbi:uncharacterized protein LOC132176120 [Corylus avellana]|uniref:uncharacterized protein LOC132176120 n=1 Tax=Corylus avellana TaxID=13451 RepID=UPI00286A6733|nr:uncharacterized protein LOC132176120 [Corylus avellana]